MTVDLIVAVAVIAMAVSLWQSARGRITLFDRALIGAVTNLALAVTWATHAAWSTVVLSATAVVVCSFSAWAVHGWDDAELRAKIRGDTFAAFRRYLRRDS